MKIIFTIIKAVLMAYLVIFAVINMQEVQLTLFLKTTPFTMPMFLFVILVLFVGFLAGILLMVGDKYTSNRHIKQMEKKLSIAEAEITRLKNIPLNDEATKENNEKTKEAIKETDNQENEAMKDVIR